MKNAILIKMATVKDKGGNKMKKLLFGVMFLALAIVVPVPTMAQVDIRISFPLPPPIVFSAPPELIVLPDTYVYVAPDIDIDFYFWNGWWWRFWEGRWYRSRYYNRGVFIRQSFYQVQVELPHKPHPLLWFRLP